MIKKKIYLTGRDYVNWATDDDYLLTKKALSPFCDFVSIQEAEIIHAVNWASLVQYNPEFLNGKYVIAHIPHDIRNMLSQKTFCDIAPLVNKFIVPSRRAIEMLVASGLTGELVPYALDTDVFYHIEKNDSRVEQIKKNYNIPDNKYLIGSFQRDTEGKDLKTPKYIKGPDIFFNIVKTLYKYNKNIHIIIAGPRRFWLREQLDREGIPYTFIGIDIKGRDDLKKNTLTQDVINILYNLIDLYIVSSRMEGGPKAILEASAARCKIISAKVGHAEDILSKDSIFDSVDIGCSIVIENINNGYLHKTVDINYLAAIRHSIGNISELWRKIYDNLPRDGKPEYKFYFKKNIPIKKSRFFFNLFSQKPIAILHKFHKPPWGGGNQFLLALKKVFANKGQKITSKLGLNVKACIFNSFTFNFKNIEYHRYAGNIRFIHRVDGPTFLARGKDRVLDDKVFELNNRIADVTVFQSFWSYQKTIELGYKPVNPIIIHNAVDPKIFHRNGRIPFSRLRKVRLISMSWSDNPRKGGETYKWIEDYLDWSRFDYTFVGRSHVRFEKIKCIDPLPSKQLAEILRQHDIYIIASRIEACSNALIEAMSCGLPTLYLNKSSHPEIVSYGGLPFNNTDEILPQLDRMVENYEMYQNLIVVPSINEVADRYLSLME